MCLALAAQGIAAPSCDLPYTFMELGFGQGVSLVMLAAANPHAQFYGIDMMAEHVAHAQALADAAGLTNLHLKQGSFADLANQTWPPFDFIAAHGVWTWVTAPLRNHIQTFVDARLKPGGLLYLSYNAKPGWAAMEPVRAVLKRAFDATSGSFEQRVQAALQTVREMEQAQALFFRANPTATVRIKQLGSESAAYIAHEYLNAEWKLFDFAEVADDWSGAGLSFAASANLQDNVIDLTVRAEARATFDAATSLAERETLKDFLLNKQFRRDIYVRRPHTLDDAQLVALHAQTRFAALMRVDQLAEAKLTTEIMTVKLNSPLHQALVEALGRGPSTLAELQTQPALVGLNPNAAFGTLFLLSAMKAVAPAASAEVARAAQPFVDRLNAELDRRSNSAIAISSRSSAIVGGGVRA